MLIHIIANGEMTMEGYEGGISNRDPDYDYIPPLPQKPAAKKGSQCGECGMKFEYGQAYGYSCGNSRCPTQFGRR